MYRFWGSFARCLQFTWLVCAVQHGLQNAAACIYEPIVDLQQCESRLRRQGAFFFFSGVWVLEQGGFISITFFNSDTS
jgi:hypothetical protein